MPKIMKLSSLRNYSEVLEEVQSGAPVYLTKNGEGAYSILDISEYESLKQSLWQRLFAELAEAVQVAEAFGWIDEKKANDFLAREGLPEAI